MALYLENLNPITREYMIKEIDYDLQKGKLYLSGRLTETGKTVYPELLKNMLKTETMRISLGS